MTSLRFGAATDTGKVRSNNQDAVLVAEPMFAVADGMGGHAAGEIASQVAVESLQASFPSNLEELVLAVREANRAVWERAADDPELRGMGTTLCAITLVPRDGHDGEVGPGQAGGTGGDQIIVVNVGDSRVYQFHDGDITQITDDHSLVEDLVREGRLSEEEARSHPQRNILTRVLGNEPDVEVDSWELVPQRGDRYLLCSDGLFNEVDDDRLASVLRRLDDPEDAAHELVSLANQGGGRDNISVVVVDVVDDDDRAEAASASLAGSGATSTIASGPRPTTSVSTAVPSPPPAPAPPGGDGPGHRATSEPASEPPRRSRPRRVTWRSVLFVFTLLVVLGGGAGAVAWFARSTYYVGFDDEQVAIFRGRPGGLLWVQPTLAERTDLPAGQVPAARREAVTAGKEAPSLDAARKYVAALEEQALAEQRRATTTTVVPVPAPAPGLGAAPTTTPPGGTAGR